MDFAIYYNFNLLYPEDGVCTLDWRYCNTEIVLKHCTGLLATFILECYLLSVLLSFCGVGQGFSKWVTGHPGVLRRQSRGAARSFDNIWNLFGHLKKYLVSF